MGDEIVRLVDMPYGVDGTTAIDENGDYNIYINARHGYIRQQKTYEHEKQHIHNEDFSNEKSISDIESKKE